VAVSDDAVTGGELSSRDERPEAPRQAKSLTIGAVCKALKQEFPEIGRASCRERV